MATKLGAYNRALLEIKQRKLASLSDANVSRRTLDDHWDSVLAEMLGEGMWNWCTRGVAIEASTEVEPEFGFTYAVPIPDDFVRLVAISSNGDFWPTLDRYHIEGGYWNTFVSPLYVRYISDGAAYGGDLSLWPPDFERALILELACRIAPHLTQMGGDALDRLKRDAKRAVHNARSKDALDQAAERPPPGRLVNARAGGGNARRGGRGLWDF